jgi:tetratricopeptide (TPR) repeat protein
LRLLREPLPVNCIRAIPYLMSLQDRYDEAAYEFTQGQFDSAITKFEAILREDPNYFDAQLGLGMAYYRKGDYARAIAEGHKAEQMRPTEQQVHTNLSLFYQKAGDKTKAEHHGLQARIASWKTAAAPGEQPPGDSELELSKPPPPTPVKLPSMPWKKKPATSPKSE